MNATTAYQSAYNTLNAKQREAVDTIEGPVMVIAGPGTGKTQILAMRIANILRTVDIVPSAILAITFTESAASAMRARLVSLIGNAGYQVTINTFHSFCNSLIQAYPEEFPRIIGSQQMTEVDQVRIVTSLIEQGTYTILKPHGDPLFYTKAILRNIHILKREGVSPTAFFTLVDQAEKQFYARDDIYHKTGAHAGALKGVAQDELKRIQKNKELAAVYKEYQNVCARDRRYDFDDMIMEVLEAFERSTDFLRTIQERYQYILIDEHQDTNNAQNKVIELLCSFDQHPNIFLVGDEKQAIYRFQGASYENFMRIREHYPNTRIIALEENYRSSQYVLDAAHGVGEHIVKRPQALQARASHKNTPIQVHSYHDATQEVTSLCKEIKTEIENGVAPEEIAIIYRENKDAYRIAQACEQQHIPYGIESDQDIFTDPLVHQLLILLRAVDDPLNAENMVAFLHAPYQSLHPLDVFGLIQYAHEKRIPLITALRRCVNTDNQDHYEDGKSCEALYKSIIAWMRFVKEHAPLTCIDVIVRESGLMQYATQAIDRLESLYKIKKIYTELERVVEQNPHATLHDLLVHIQLMEDHQLALKAGAGKPTIGRVRLMTAHKSKGLEFDHVYIPYAYDGHWGNKRMPAILPLLPNVYVSDKTLQEHQETTDSEDRRLFYVALTRARKTAHISYARHDELQREQLPCVYISEIRPDTMQYHEVPYEEVAPNMNQTIVVQNTAASIQESVRRLAQEELHRKGLSVTALNNYKTCPWKYFYVNLLTVPQTKQPHQMYGTAMHATYKDTLAYIQEETRTHELISKYLSDRFRTHITHQPFSQQDLEIYTARGLEALAHYAPIITTQWHIPARGEFKISGVQITKEVALHGIIDRMETLPGNAVRVVDYKTGKHKSRAEIEGKTKTSTGDIFRQLVFYKLLLDAYEKGTYHMESGKIEFVEPNEKGAYRQEEFFVSDAQVKELTEYIHQVINEIENLSFWDTRCEDASCEFCELRNMMRVI